MEATQALIGCLAFILGLLVAAIPWAGWLLLALGGVAAWAGRRVWRSPLPAVTWLVAGAIALMAGFYLQLRAPQPAQHDISRLLTPTEATVQAVVEGQVLSLPRLTRNETFQVWLQAQAIAPIGDGQPVTGKVYTTIPAEAAPALHPGQIVQVGGTLYLPKPALSPGQFDFKAYLQQEGSFAGLRGQQVTVTQADQRWGWWQLQQRIIQAQQQGLGQPEGALVSAMVLGGRAVDLSFELKDAFVRVGLAHALAASGFQTSLILGVVLALTRRSSERVQFVAGTVALASFVGLAGCQPAVLRAAIMGFGGLVALVLNRSVKPLGSLLLTAVILLVIHPLWIWDLGFQLSFLATLGLLVTVPPIAGRLAWLPSAIAPMIAVPIAAYLWTLPLQLGEFGVLSPYSIPVNILTTPLISLISLGGMASALMAVVWMPAGSLLAGGLKYPTQALIAIVHGFNQLPGNGWAIGTISMGVVVGLYVLLSLASGQRWWQNRWWLALGLGLGLVLFPLALGATTTQATVLATPQAPALVLRDRGRVLVFGGGQAQTVQSTLLPFLQRAGINQIDWAIALHPDTAAQWANVAHRLPIRYLLQPPMPPAHAPAHPPGSNSPQAIELDVRQMATLGATQVTVLSLEPAIAQLAIGQQTWLWLDRMTATQQSAVLQTVPLPPADVLWWSGQSLAPEWVQAVRPKVAIASNRTIKPETEKLLQQQNISLFVTGQDGTIQWTAASGFAADSNKI